MSWILGGLYCGIVWLIFAKLKLLRLSFPIAVLLASVGPLLLVALLFCAQYFHPYTDALISLQNVDPITAQLTRPGRVTRIAVDANTPVEKGDVLFEVDREPYENAVTRGKASVAQAEQGVKVAEASVALGKATVDRAIADLQFAKNDRDRYTKLRDDGGASEDEYERAMTRYEQARAAARQADQSLKQAELSVDTAKEHVQQARTQLTDAQYDLSQTTVRAPAAGFVTNLQLREGMLVGGGTAGAVMSFVRDRGEEQQGVVVATFVEKNYLMIHSGQYCEIALDGYPGRIFTGRVLNPIDISGEGQLTAGGTLPKELLSGKRSLFAVRMQIDDGENMRIPGGAQGQAAVYTQHAQIAGIPIMFLIRAKSWMKYLL